MKQILSVILITLFVFACTKKKTPPYFTGTVSYAYTYESDSMDADSIAALRPSKSDFRYDTTGYQSRFIARDTETIYYSGQLNKAVSVTNNTKNYTCEDYGLVTDSIVSWKIYDTEEKVLGYSCRILEMQKRNSWVKYYVCPELKIAPATYASHKAYNWDAYGKYAKGGLILRSEHRFKNFTLKGVATSVEKRPQGFKALEVDTMILRKVCNE
jgi:hypothetical protein